MKLKIYSLLFVLYFVLPIGFRELIVYGIAVGTVDWLSPYFSEARLIDIAVGIHRSLILFWFLSLPVIAYTLMIAIIKRLDEK